jgi:hypothetical protein
MTAPAISVFPALVTVRDRDGDLWHLNPVTGLWHYQGHVDEEMTLDEVVTAWGPVAEIHDDMEVPW